MYLRALSALKNAESVSDVSYITLEGRLCDVMVLNT
jgi:hypothetical protein